MTNRSETTPIDDEAMDAPAVRDRIRRRILTGTYAPNQRLIETELSTEFGASRPVIRVALQELAIDGLVEIQKNRGARVRAISAEETIEIVECRMVLEGLAAARAARRATPEEVEELRDIARRMRAALDSGEVLGYGQLNVLLHDTIARISDNATCTKTLRRLSGQLTRYQFALSLRPGRQVLSQIHHEAIVEAIAKEDCVGAEAAMREHLQSFADEMRRSA